VPPGCSINDPCCKRSSKASDAEVLNSIATLTKFSFRTRCSCLSNPTFHPTDQNDGTGPIRHHRSARSVNLGRVRRHRTTPTVCSITRSSVRSPRVLLAIGARNGLRSCQHVGSRDVETYSCVNVHSPVRLYTRVAVPKNMSSRSLAEYGAAIFFSPFHNTRYESE